MAAVLRRRMIVLGALVALDAALLLVGGGDEPGAGEAEITGRPVRVGLVFDVGGRGAGPVNHAACLVLGGRPPSLGLDVQRVQPGEGPSEGGGDVDRDQPGKLGVLEWQDAALGSRQMAVRRSRR